MSRRSFQRVTLSVELTLPAGAKAGDAPEYLRALLSREAPRIVESLNKIPRLDDKLAIIKILKRETIYTN